MASINDYATIDYDRASRCGFAEVVFGEGKTPKQVVGIALDIAAAHEVVLVTRATPKHACALQAAEPDARYVESCQLLYIDRRAAPLRIDGTTATEILASGEDSESASAATAKGNAEYSATNARPNNEHSAANARPNNERGAVEGLVVVCCAGTSDLAVAEEAAITARIMGSRTVLLADVGVAGVHRVLEKQKLLASARVLVAVAGMEGALPSLVAGLVDVPVIAVPTSVGYGASFGGIAALLGMLTSCAGGVSVVNIDNGFGAGQIAHRINAPRWLEETSPA